MSGLFALVGKYSVFRRYQYQIDAILD